MIVSKTWSNAILMELYENHIVVPTQTLCSLQKLTFAWFQALKHKEVYSGKSCSHFCSTLSHSPSPHRNAHFLASWESFPIFSKQVKVCIGANISVQGSRNIHTLLFSLNTITWSSDRSSGWRASSFISYNFIVIYFMDISLFI